MGDYSYNIWNNDGERGDDYFAQMEPVLTKAPVVLIPGNHENIDATSFLTRRFIMPNQQLGNNLFSFEFGGGGWLAFNFDLPMNLHPEKYWGYLEMFRQTLEKLRGRTNRGIAFFTHRALFCHNQFTDECNQNVVIFKPFMDMLEKYKVALVLQAHQHFY